MEHVKGCSLRSQVVVTRCCTIGPVLIEFIMRQRRWCKDIVGFTSRILLEWEIRCLLVRTAYLRYHRFSPHPETYCQSVRSSGQSFSYSIPTHNNRNSKCQNNQFLSFVVNLTICHGHVTDGNVEEGLWCLMGLKI